MSVKSDAQQAFHSFELAFRTKDDSSEYVRVRESDRFEIERMTRRLRNGLV